jgi:preprotein translocase subunit SecD
MMEFYKDNRFFFLLLMFLIFAYGVVAFAGWLLIVALLFFGFVSFIWKDPHIRLSGMVLLVLLALVSIYFNGLNFGIDFVGGTRIPVLLDHPVDQATMTELVQNIKSRASTLGLKEVKARAIGDTVVNVEIASTDEQTISFIENTLSQQGVFLGVVDGQTAVSGDHIFRTTIRPLDPNTLLQQGADWGVAFSVDRDGAEQFAQAAKGKADYPIYMFIDRPQDAAVFYERSMFRTFISPDSGEKESLRSLNDTLRLSGDDIPVYIIDDMSGNFSAPDNKTKAIVAQNMSQENKDRLKEHGYILVEKNDSSMTPEFTRTRTGVLVVSKMDGLGLLTAPLLGGSITSGVPNYNYIVTGHVNATDPKIKSTLADAEVKNIESILKGGALPVQISLGSRTTLPAELGSEFLRLSLIAIVGSLVIISILIGIRYRNLRATMPIVLISLAELVILIAILGSFTIDLAAMAGIIAAIGVGVDAQIVITDELLKKDEEHTTHEKVELAFGIIRTNAIVAIFSMIPLLFSGLVEIIGFAMSTMLGALLGYLLTRPAYAAIVEGVIEAERKAGKTGKA